MNPRGLSARSLILMAEDDEDDRVLVRDAFAEARLPGEIRFVADGQDLLDYLRRAGTDQAERPQIVLLDLNMPRKDGREALAEMKADEELCEIPVVVLTTSTDQEDIKGSYCLGASSFITKPVSHAGLVDVMRDLTDYWFRLVELPG
ncbi:MAG: response regulator [Solirubrobacteraceae bacterium]